MSKSYMDEEAYMDAFSNLQATEYVNFGKWLEYVFEGKFKCYDPDASEMGKWYYKHENSEWKEDKDEEKLREAISTDGYNMLMHHMSIITSNLKVEGLLEEYYDLMHNRMKELAYIVPDLQEAERITLVIKHMKQTFYDANFKPKSME